MLSMSAYAGLGDEADRMTPTQVAALAHTRVLLASCGGAHTAALTDSDRLEGYSNLAPGPGRGTRPIAAQNQLIKTSSRLTTLP